MPRSRPIRAGDADTSGDAALDDGARGRACHSRLWREWLGDRRAERGRAHWADPRNLEPIVLVGCDDCGNAAKAIQESTRSYNRDAGDSRKHFLPNEDGRRLETLRIPWPVAARPSAPDPTREETKPHDGVMWIRASDKRNSLADDSETCASNPARRERAVVEIVTLDEEIRERRSSTESPNLNPKTASLEAEVEIGDALALDERSPTEVVVAHFKGCSSHIHTLRTS